MSGDTSRENRIRQASDGVARPGRVVACAGCAVRFYAYPSEKTKRFCGPQCRVNRETRTCSICPRTFVAKKAHRKKTCSRGCSRILMGIAATERWKDPATRAKAIVGLSAAAKADPLRSAKLDHARNCRKFSEETRNKIRAARLKQRFPVRETKIERLLRLAMTARGVRFREQVTMFGRWQPDFVVDEATLVVQADGEYWHSRPEAIANDRRFDAAARRAGWEVIRFSDKQILGDADGCVEKIISVARSRIAWAEGREVVPRESLRAKEPPKQRSLFEETGS